MSTRIRKLPFVCLPVGSPHNPYVVSKKSKASQVADAAQEREASRASRHTVTAKPAEVGMGSGKGDPKHYVFEVRPGRVLFELDGVPEDVARAYLRHAGMKLPVNTSVIARR